MQIQPPKNTNIKPDKDTAKGLKEGLSFTTRFGEFILNDKSYACAFIIGFLLLLLFTLVHAGGFIFDKAISQELLNALDNLWSAFLLCLGVMLGGKMEKNRHDN